MTWAEFNLRLIGFQAKEDRDLLKVRRIAWTSLIAPYQNPKALKGLTENKWWKIGASKTKKVTTRSKSKYLEKYKEYLIKKNGKTRG